MDAWGRHLWQLTVGRRPLGGGGGGGGGAGVVGVLGPAESPPPGSTGHCADCMAPNQPLWDTPPTPGQERGRRGEGPPWQEWTERRVGGRALQRYQCTTCAVTCASASMWGL